MTQGQEQMGMQPATERVVGGRYVVLGEIGRGGMGVVWLAEDRMIGRRVAIKELHLPDGVPAEERHVFEERVLREARTAGRLNDPAVVTVYDVLQDSGATYIVMELIDAPTLSAVVREQGPLPPERVVSLAEQLLSALEAAHAAGIVHRDVKPSNIMVLPNGRAKLTDFGIAQSVDDPRLTTSGILVGSPTYMAPERLRGEEAGPASDLWALGATLFCAVEGYTPYERPTTAATMHAIMYEVPYLTRCHGPLASAIMGLLISTPEARLGVQQVRGLLAQTMPQTMPQVAPGPDDRTTPVRGTAMYPAHGATRLAGAPAPHPPARRGRGILAIALVVALLAGLGGGWFARPWLVDDGVPVNMAPVMTYGEGGDIPELDFTSSETCLAGKLEQGRKYAASTTVDCDELHDAEVFDWRETFKTTDESDRSAFKRPTFDYPGEESLRQYAEAYCAMSFASEWVSLPADEVERGEKKEAVLKFQALIPSRQAWEKLQRKAESGNDSDRDFLCVAYRADGAQMTKQLRAGD